MFESLINVTSLKYVDLSKLGIMVLHSPVFKYLPFIQTLILNDNPALGTTGYMLNFMSKYFSNLRHIELVNVRLDTLHIYLFVTRMSGTKLKSLVLDRNLISKINLGIYKGFRSLEVVCMSYNQMSSPIDLIAELLASVRRYAVAGLSSCPFDFSSRDCLDDLLCPHTSSWYNRVHVKLHV